MNYNLIKYPSALSSKAIYGGVYTQDLVTLSLIAFVITKLMEGMDVNLIYGVIGLTCGTTYSLMLIRRKYLATGFFIFWIRKCIGLNKKNLEATCSHD